MLILILFLMLTLILFLMLILFPMLILFLKLPRSGGRARSCGYAAARCCCLSYSMGDT
jgi:hypothetical protein